MGAANSGESAGGGGRIGEGAAHLPHRLTHHDAVGFIDACLGQKSEVSTFSERMAAAEARLDQLESDRDSQAAQISALETQNGLIEARLDEAEATIANILEILDGPL